MFPKSTSIDAPQAALTASQWRPLRPMFRRDVKDRAVNTPVTTPRYSGDHSISTMVRYAISHNLPRKLLALTCAAVGLLSGCGEEQKISVGYRVVNHTNGGVVYITVNQQGGILVADPLGGSGDACCVSIPRQWRPELQVTVGWQDDSTKQLDAAGKPVMRDGKHVLNPGQKYSRTVPIQEYKPNNLGTMNLHILPDKNVIAAVSMLMPTHPDYLPKNPLQRPRQP
jgi:Protein of unknown function (DUF3304)